MGGEFKFLKISKDSSLDEALVLVIQDELLVCGIMCQQSKKTLYIECVDTTGHCKPRSLQNLVVRSLISAVVQKMDLVETFSLPKEELIFGKSVNNGSKGVLNEKKLLNFWISNFQQYGKVFVYSNYYPTKSVPYKNMKDIEYFYDDPKSCMKLEDTDVHTYYELLLHKKEFQRGSLVYLKPRVPSRTWMFPDNYISYDGRMALNLLRNLDFSDDISNKKSTQEFLLPEFLSELHPFELLEPVDRACIEEVKPNIIVIKPRRK